MEELLSQFGGILLPNQMGGVQRGFSEVVDAIVRWDKDRSPESSPSITLHWIRNWDANAIAFEHDNAAQIAVFGGTATLLAAIVLAVGRSQDYLPHLQGGEPTRSSFAAARACFARRLPEHARDPIPDAEEIFRPPSDTRAYVVSDLIWAGASILVLHEIAHHRRGHVRLDARESGAWGIYEAQGNLDQVAPTAPSDLRRRRAMEVDADAAALADALALLQSIATSSSDCAEVTAQCVHDVALMHGVVCSIFDYEQLGLVGFRERSHPHPSVRFLYGIREIVRWADASPLSAEQVETAVLTAIKDVQWISQQFDWTLLASSEDRRIEIDEECRHLRGDVRDMLGASPLADDPSASA